jgi:hypothetical protein
MTNQTLSAAALILAATTTASVSAPPIVFVALSDEVSPTGQQYTPFTRNPRFGPAGPLVFSSEPALFAYEPNAGVSVLILSNEPVAPGVGYSPNSEEFTMDDQHRIMTLGGLFGSNPGITFGTAGNLVLVAAEGALAPLPFDAHQFTSISDARLSSTGVILFKASVAGESTLWQSEAGQTPELLLSQTYTGLIERPLGFVGVGGGDLAISAAGDILWVGSIEVNGINRLTVLHSDLSGTIPLLRLGDQFEDGTWEATHLVFPIQVNDDSTISIVLQSGPEGGFENGTRTMYGPPAQFVPNTNALTTARGGHILTSSGVVYSADMPQNDEFDLRRFDGATEETLTTDGDAIGDSGDTIGGNLGDATANARGDVVFQSWIDHTDGSRTFAMLHYHNDYNTRTILLRDKTFEVRPGDLRQVANWSYIRNTGGVGGENSGLSEDGQFAFRVDFADGSSGIAVADLTAVAPCPADFAEPFGEIDFFDVQAYLSLFAAGDLRADIAPPPSGDGVLTFFDVLEFLNRFAEGCP